MPELSRYFTQVSLVNPIPNGMEQTGTSDNPLPTGMYVLNTATLMWEPWDKSVTGGGGGGGGDASAANQVTQIGQLNDIFTKLDAGEMAVTNPYLDATLSTRASEAKLEAVRLLLAAGIPVTNFPATSDVSDRDARLLGRVKTFDAVGNVVSCDDPRDRDTRLLGRAKILDSTGAVIDPALKSQLPAALVGGRVDVRLGADGVGLALDATLTGGNQVAIAKGGAKGATAAALLTGTAEGADHQGLDVQIYHGGVAKDPTAIRALTNADIVKAQLQDNAGTAITLAQKVMASSVPVVMPSDQWPDAQARAIYYRPRKLTTYRATFRLAARPYALSNAFGAAGRKQYATLHHLVASTKLVKLRHVWVAIESASAAAIVVAELIRITAATTPATGNPGITAALLDGSFAAADTTLLALPTTAGTEAGSPWAASEWNLGVTAAGSTVNPAPPLTWVDLVRLGGSSINDDEGMFPQIRSGVQEGWAITFDCSAVATIKGFIKVELTEE